MNIKYLTLRLITVTGDYKREYKKNESNANKYTSDESVLVK